MNFNEWFKQFISHYRDIVNKKYADIKEEFPFYPPVDIDIVLIEDPKNRFPYSVAFFNLGLSEEIPANDIITVNTKKIEWKTNTETFDYHDSRIQFEDKWHETFYDYNIQPGLIAQETFSEKTFEADPRLVANSFVMKHFIHQKQRRNLENFFGKSKFRIGSTGIDNINSLIDTFSKFKNLKDTEKADAISKAFWIMGFEVLNLEALMQIPEYSKLKSMPHVDVIAVIYPQKILVSVDEGEINKGRWYKLNCLESTLDYLEFLGKKEEWKVIHLAIGRKSKGITFLEGEVQVISLEYFTNTFKKFIKRKSWVSLMRAIRNILGYDLNFFRYIA